MTLVIRSAIPEDAPACVRILRGWIEETPWMPVLHSEEEMVRFWAGRIEAADAFVAVESGRIKGFCVRGSGVLTALYLAPDVRGRGVGRQLLDRARQGTGTLDLQVFAANDAARRFYLREGFFEVSRSCGDNEEGLPDIQMRWVAEPGR